MSSSFLRIRLTPRAGGNAITRFEDGVLHVRVAAPPVDGAANTALVSLLSDALRHRKSAIIIVSGATSREKQVEIQDLTPEQLTERVSALLSGKNG